MDIKQSKRIQTSVLNGMEKRALVWLAERQPKWVSSNLMTFVGFVGAAVVAAGAWLQPAITRPTVAVKNTARNFFIVFPHFHRCVS